MWYITDVINVYICIVDKEKVRQGRFKYREKETKNTIFYDNSRKSIKNGPRSEFFLRSGKSLSQE